MTISAPRTEHPESVSSGDSRSAWGQKARQPEHIAAKRLARGYIPALCAGVSIPPLMFISSVFPLGWEGIIAVTGWSTLAIVYVATVLNRMRGNISSGARQWDTMRDRALDLEDAYYKLACAHERLKNKYNDLYAEYLLQRGVASLMAKRSGRGAAADLPSGVNGSAAVVPFSKTDGSV